MGIYGSSDTRHGHYQQGTDDSKFDAVYANPRNAMLTVTAYLSPSGGVSKRSVAFTQWPRPAVSHALRAWTPDVYPNHRTAWFAIACRDQYGDPFVSGCNPAVSVSGALASYGSAGSVWSVSGTQMSMFSVSFGSKAAFASAASSMVTVTTTLAGYDSQQASFTVHPTPVWASERMTSHGAGIGTYVTSDAAGAWATDSFEAGDTLYVQLYANTGGVGLGSFELKLRHDTSVCEVVPSSGSFSSSFTGPIRHSFSASYSTESTERLINPNDATDLFVKMSGVVAVGTPIDSTHGHLGYVAMRMVGSGSCLTSTEIDSFYDDLDAGISGWSFGQAAVLHGNMLRLLTSKVVGVLAQSNVRLPVTDRDVEPRILAGKQHPSRHAIVSPHHIPGSHPARRC